MQQLPVEEQYSAYVLTRAEMSRNSIYLKQPGSGDNLYLVCVILLLLHFLLFTTKTMFELSLGIAKFTNFLELGHLAAIFVACVSYLIEAALKGGMAQELKRINEGSNIFLLVD